MCTVAVLVFAVFSETKKKPVRRVTLSFIFSVISSQLALLFTLFISLTQHSNQGNRINGGNVGLRKTETSCFFTFVLWQHCVAWVRFRHEIHLDRVRKQPCFGLGYLVLLPQNMAGDLSQVEKC